jgi:hypothetical protein
VKKSKNSVDQISLKIFKMNQPHSYNLT